MQKTVSNKYLRLQCSLKKNYSFVGWVILLCLVCACEPCSPGGSTQKQTHIAAKLVESEVILLSKTTAEFQRVGSGDINLPKQMFDRRIAYTIAGDPFEGLWVFEEGANQRWAFNPLGESYPIFSPVLPVGDLAYFGNSDTSTIYSVDQFGNLRFVSGDRLNRVGILYSALEDMILYVGNGAVNILDATTSEPVGNIVLSAETASVDETNLLGWDISKNGQYIVLYSSNSIDVYDLLGQSFLRSIQTRAGLSIEEESDPQISDDGQSVYYLVANEEEGLPEAREVWLAERTTAGEDVNAVFYSTIGTNDTIGSGNRLSQLSLGTEGELLLVIGDEAGNSSLVEIDKSTAAIKGIVISGAEKVVVGN